MSILLRISLLESTSVRSTVSLRAVRQTAPTLATTLKATLMNYLRPILLILLGAGFCSAPANAALVFETEVVAEFDVSFYSSGPLAAAATGAGFPLDTPLAAAARGTIHFTMDDITPGTTSAAIQNAVSIGRLQGFVPGNFFSISPNVQFVGGTLNNIQQSGGVVTSADVVDLSMIWDMELITSGGTARIVSAAPLPFSGNVAGLPFNNGDQIAGPMPGTIDGLLDIGGGNLAPNPAIAVSNRFLTAVPEPSSGVLAFLAAAGIFWRRTRGS